MVLLEDDFLGILCRKGNFLSILGESDRSDCCRCVMWCWNQSGFARSRVKSTETDRLSLGWVVWRGKEQKRKREKCSGRAGRKKLFSRACITGVRVLNGAPVVMCRLLVDKSGGGDAAARSRRRNRCDVVMRQNRAVDATDKVFKSLAFLVTRSHGVQRPIAFFVAVEGEERKAIKWCLIYEQLSNGY